MRSSRIRQILGESIFDMSSTDEVKAVGIGDPLTAEELRRAVELRLEQERQAIFGVSTLKTRSGNSYEQRSFQGGSKNPNLQPEVVERKKGDLRPSAADLARQQAASFRVCPRTV